MTFRAFNANFDATSSSYMDDTPLPMSDGSLLLRRFYSRSCGSQRSFIGIHSFSSQAGSESEKEPIKEADMSGSESESESELDLLDAEEETTENNDRERRGSSGLFKAVVESSTMNVKNALDKWLEEGHDLSRSEISHAIFELRRRRMYGKALQVLDIIILFFYAGIRWCLDVCYKLDYLIIAM